MKGFHLFCSYFVAFITSAAAFSGTTTTTTVCVADRPDTTNYREILLSNAPLLDVRAPVEYEAGAISSTSVNIPLLNNDERHQIGICYKEHGQEAAIALGNQLVSGSVKAERMRRWKEFVRENPNDGYLYCYRGGLRSGTVQEWLHTETGTRYPLITGGYKKMRQYLMDELERSLDAERTDLVIVSGKTGVGKTRMLHQLGPKCSIDLEGLAHHRGSSFGAFPEDIHQKGISQIDFENSISISLLKILAAADTQASNLPADMQQTQRTRVYIEDEGSRIGRLSLPHALWHRMKKCSNLIIVEEDIEDRVNMILEDYILDLGQRYIALYGIELGPIYHRDRMLGDLKRIRKLGADRLKRLSDTMMSAFAAQTSSGDTTLHRIWIAELLNEYYDPMYEYQLSQRVDHQVLFRGKCNEVAQWTAATCS